LWPLTENCESTHKKKEEEHPGGTKRGLEQNNFSKLSNFQNTLEQSSRALRKGFGRKSPTRIF